MRKMDYHRAAEAQETFVDDTPAIAPARVDVLIDWLRNDAADAAVAHEESGIQEFADQAAKSSEIADTLEVLAALVRPRVIRDCRPVLAAVRRA